jgi:hypothetical protein
MGYIEDNLLENESIIYIAKLHWITFKWTGIWLFITLIALSSGKEGLSAVPGGLILTGICGVLAYLNYQTSEFGLTNKRVIIKTGIIRRKSVDVLLTKIEGVQVKQGLFGRMMGYGTVVVSGTGGLWGLFQRISNPLDFRNKIQGQLSSIQKQPASDQPPKRASLCIHCGKYYEGNPSFCPNCGKSTK